MAVRGRVPEDALVDLRAIPGSGAVQWREDGGARIIGWDRDSVAVFALTTPTDDLLSDLERRGMGRRAVFVWPSNVDFANAGGPRMAEQQAAARSSRCWTSSSA